MLIRRFMAFGLIVPALLLTAVVPASAEVQEQVSELNEVTIANPCAVFVDPIEDEDLSRIRYTEEVLMDFTLTTRLDNENQNASLILVGEGEGNESDLRYDLRAEANLSQSNFNTEEPEIVFYVDARLRTTDPRNQASPSLFSESAGITFQLALTLSPGDEIELVDFDLSNFKLSCEGENWENLTSNHLDNGSGGKGFGDPWNKYAWSMKDFEGKMYVGTKSSFYDLTSLSTPPPPLSGCPAPAFVPDEVTTQSALELIPSLYQPLVALELFDSERNFAGALDRTTSRGASSGRAEIWSYSYDNENWSKSSLETLEGGGTSQGFRIMETHDDRLYAGSDLGSFIMGVELGSVSHSSECEISTYSGDFPGSKIVVTDGTEWTDVPCEPDGSLAGPCTSAENVAITGLIDMDVNTSFRAMASHEGDLYVGTFNFTGAELWKYDDDAEPGDAWILIETFDGSGDLDYTPAITELISYRGKLVIGTGFDSGASATKYLWEYSSGSVRVVPGLLPATGASSVLKLLVSDSGDLYVGLVDFDGGADLLVYRPGTGWDEITADGFGTASNVYVWSMEEFDNKIFLGTFNTNFFGNAVPRGSAELWMSDDDGITWQQQPMPLRWSLLNYGIRTMAVGDGELFMGSASNMLAPDLLSAIPDLIDLPEPISQLPSLLDIGAGAEVWRSTREIPRRSSGTISATPLAISMGKVTETTATISWTSMAGASGYRIYLDSKLAGEVGPTVTSHKFTGLKKGSSHTLKVAALMGGQEVFWAEHSLRTNDSKRVRLFFTGSKSVLSSANKASIKSVATKLAGYSKVWIELKPIQTNSNATANKYYRTVSRARLARAQKILEANGIQVSTAAIKNFANGKAVKSGAYQLVVRVKYMD